MGPHEREWARGNPGEFWGAFPACHPAMNYENNPASAAYIPVPERRRYYRGGLFGGTTAKMVEACSAIADSMDIDAANGIVAIVQDESHVNR